MIKTKALKKAYQTSNSPIYPLDGIDLNIPKGSFTAIVGSSGSGKSTLLNTLGLIDRADSGEYFLDGEEVFSLSDRELVMLRRRLLGFVFQSYNLIPRMTALENVELALAIKGVPRQNRRALALEALVSVGLENRINHLPSEMSGGQQQRTAIARAIAPSPKLILADEPTGNLDEENSKAITEILSEQNRRGVTVLLITHSSEVAASANIIYRMKNGKLSPENKYS